MKRIFVALAILAIQAATPVPRCCAYAATDDHGNINQQSKSDSTPPDKPSPPVNANPSIKDGDAGDSKSFDDKKDESVKVIEFPVVSVRTGPSEIVYLIFSGLLVMVGAIQAYFLFRTLKAIQDQATRMKDQLAVTEKELVLVQRPRISAVAFYFLEFKPVGAAYFIPKGIEVGSDCSGQFYITNNGGTNAHVREIFCTAIVAATLPMKRPYEGLDGEKVDIILSPAQSFTWMFHLAQPLDGATTTAIQVKSQSLYVLGRITYRDELRIPRQNYFCHRLDYAKDRFVPVDDFDYQSYD